MKDAETSEGRRFRARIQMEDARTEHALHQYEKVGLNRKTLVAITVRTASYAPS